MPELPEVETVCQGLKSTIVGKTITDARNFRPNLRIAFPDNFSTKLQGKTIADVKRRAKYILINLNDNNTILAHLGMSGKIIVYNGFQNSRQKHDHALWQFDNGSEMVFNDPRRFGVVTFCATDQINQHKLIANLGIEPLIKEFDGKLLHKILSNKKTTIKNEIMDASLVVGVGNIYACEALFRSNISPLEQANKVTKTKCIELAINIKDVLNQAIKSGGSTLRDYVASSGDKGYFQHSFKVYGRENEPCIICKNPIKRIRQSGRSSFYCSNCQS